MQARSAQRIEATPEAENGWMAHAHEVAAKTLFKNANSWYMGANIPGKPRVFLPYIGGLGNDTVICNDVATADYRGFVFASGLARAAEPEPILNPRPAPQHPSIQESR